MANPGDQPIVFNEYQFTMADAAYISGVTEKTIRNWMARDVLKIGKKHFLGRWTFNFIDLMRLTIMNDLTEQVAMAPIEAATVAMHPVILEIAMRSSMRDEDGQLLDLIDGKRPNVNLLVAFEKGQAVVAAFNVKNPGAYPPNPNDKSIAVFRRAHATVPIYALISDLILRVEQLIIERNQNDEVFD